VSLLSLESYTGLKHVMSALGGGRRARRGFHPVLHSATVASAWRRADRSRSSCRSAAPPLCAHRRTVFLARR
jgi:hypothetical protein